jgi:hypothetical protein
MGTNVRLTRSGGIAGLSMVADVDLDQLPEPTAERVRTALAEVDFDRPAPPARSARAPGPVDTYQYDLEVDDGTGKRRSLTVHDPVSDPALQTLLKALLPLATPE